MVKIKIKQAEKDCIIEIQGHAIMHKKAKISYAVLYRLCIRHCDFLLVGFPMQILLKKIE